MEKIPFDELAFRNGAVALTIFGEEEVRYLRDDESREGFMVVKWEGCYFDQHLSRQFANSNLSMKPTTSEGGTEDWIKHDGGPCPIPWAKKGEYEAKRADGLLYSSMIDANEIQSWEEMHIAIETQITDYRLTQGWLPVKGDGTIPAGIVEAKAGEFEVKYRSGAVYLSYIEPKKWVPHFDHTGVSYADIVAVRLVQKKVLNDEWVPTVNGRLPFECLRGVHEFKYGSGKTQINTMRFPKGADAGQIVAVRLVQKENCGCKEPRTRNNTPAIGGGYQGKPRKETTQQSINRAALSRFRSSPRGKEFRAQLGHVDTPPPAIGQDAIEGAIFAALCESMRKEGR